MDESAPWCDFAKDSLKGDDIQELMGLLPSGRL